MTLLEMAKGIVAAHAQTTRMSTKELISEIHQVYETLQALESGTTVVSETPEEPSVPTLTIKQAFKKDEVICMLCGKGKMQSLGRHLTLSHHITQNEYRKQFGISKNQPLMSKNYVAKRKEIASGIDLAGNLEKARAARGSFQKTTIKK